MFLKGTSVVENFCGRKQFWIVKFIFLVCPISYKNKFDGTDKNIVIFGHNRRDGSMFGTLKNVLEKKWYTNENNKYITLVAEKKSYKYEIFSVYKIKDEDYYITTGFDNNDKFKEFVDTLKNRSIYDFGNLVEKTDKIKTGGGHRPSVLFKYKSNK